MSEIALYTALTKLGLEPKEAKEAVADVASSKNVATKADIKGMVTKADLAEQETRLVTEMSDLKAEMYRINNRTIMWIVVVGVAVVGTLKYL